MTNPFVFDPRLVKFGKRRLSWDYQPTRYGPVWVVDASYPTPYGDLVEQIPCPRDSRCIRRTANAWLDRALRWEVKSLSAHKRLAWLAAARAAG